MPLLGRPLARTVVSILAACTLTAAAAQPTGTLRMAIPGDEGSLTPYTYVTGYPGYELMSLVYDQLFVLDDALTPRPWLAASLEVDGALDHRIRLRDDVRWHDGEPFDAGDVAFTFDYYRTHVMSRFTGPAARVLEIAVHGPLELTLTLEAPDPTFVETVLTDLPMLPEHVWRDLDEPRTAREAIGTGPYRLVQIEPERFYRFEANTDFWGATPALASLVAAVVRDETTTFQALRAGEIDMAVRGVPPASAATFAAMPGVEVVRGSNFATTMLIMDVTRPGLDDVRVRRAIASAIDHQRLVDVLLLGAGTVGAPGFLHPDTPYANPDTRRPASAEPGEVRERLQAAGYLPGPDGVYRDAAGTRLAFELLAPSNRPTRLRAAELIAQDLAAVGIEARVRAMEFDALTERVWPGFDVSRGRDYELALFGWSAPVAARADLMGLLHSDPSRGTLNLAGYADPEVDRLTEAASRAADRDERRALLQRVQEIVADDVPFVPLFYEAGVYAYRPDAYDGWSYLPGRGILYKASFLAR